MRKLESTMGRETIGLFFKEGSDAKVLYACEFSVAKCRRAKPFTQGTKKILEAVLEPP